MSENDTHSMFEPFSSGYYLGRLYVQPRNDGGPAIARAQHEQVNEQLYATGEGLERTDFPLVMKLENTHFAVQGEEDVPEDTLAVPEELIAETRIDNPPTLKEVFLAEADRAKQLLSISERLPGAGGPSDLDSEGAGQPVGR